MSLIVTSHAKDRIKQRCGLPKRAAIRNAEKALQQGISHADTTGRFKKYFDYLYLSHGNANNIRVLGDKVYIFCGESLITVLSLPNQHRSVASKLLKRREN